MVHSVFRGRFLHFFENPHQHGDSAWQYLEDGILWVEEGHIAAFGPASNILRKIPKSLQIRHKPEHLFLPGFVDTHVHYPQIEMIAAYGNQLLEWLRDYTFPVESKFADAAYARAVARRFLTELLRNGTTTALVFCSVHKASVDAFFQAAGQRNARMIAGKVMMDRNAPEVLLDNAEDSYTQSRELIQCWHQRGRFHYAVTPRFAPTSTPQQLTLAARLLTEFPDLYLHTHLSENQAEIEWVKRLFPERTSYLDVYRHYGLVGPRSIFAHGIHLHDSDFALLAHEQSALAHCPTSNLFLGSGLFDLASANQHGIKVGLGTDIGAGTSFSMLQTMAEAYKIQQLRGATLDPLQAFYLATLGGAKALSLEHKIGNFKLGKEADFIEINPEATPLLRFRSAHCNHLTETLFALAVLGDDRCIAATYLLGQPQHYPD
ncbi:MAG TPA: guanine deaminase [Gammaproteobacteria bacterium]|nr:guanine deaminase [Gammaproteobacteria bacterium]